MAPSISAFLIFNLSFLILFILLILLLPYPFAHSLPNRTTTFIHAAPVFPPSFSPGWNVESSTPRRAVITRSEAHFPPTSALTTKARRTEPRESICAVTVTVPRQRQVEAI